MYNYITIKKNVSPLLQLMVPLILTGLVQSSVWFFETLFLAKLGPETLAAGALVTWLLTTLSAILYGTLSSINILVAHQFGHQDEKGIALVARDGLLLTSLFLIPAFILFWYMPTLFSLFGLSDSIVALSKPYLHALSWGLIANFFTIAFFEVIMGIGKTRIILLFSTLVVILNIILSYILIFGKLGFKAYGIAGAGWGITISDWITIFLLLIYLFYDKKYRNYFRYLFSLRKPQYLLELLSIGLPAGVMYCVEVGFFFVITVLIGRMSSDIQAANQVALQYFGLFMAPMFAIAQAMTVRTGHLLGANHLLDIKVTHYIGMVLALIFTGLVAIVYWTAPHLLIGLDFDISNQHNLNLINWVKQFLMICALFQIVEGFRLVYFGTLRGFKDTRFILIISIISLWFIALPLGYFLTKTIQSPIGYWWGLFLGTLLSIIFLYYRFKFLLPTRKLTFKKELKKPFFGNHSIPSTHKVN